MRISRRYLSAIVLLTVFAAAFGVFGTVAPPLAEESAPIQPQQESSSESVGHFQNPPTYDSGWVDIQSKAGQDFFLEHDLNTTNVVVDITGKQSLEPSRGAPAWNKTYGAWYYDLCYCVVQTVDGGYALAGFSDPTMHGITDLWLVKTDSTGTMLWSKTYGGTGADYAQSVVETVDGGYALAGYTRSYGAGGYDFWLIKTDSTGTMLWNKTYGGTGDDGAYSVVQTGDGGYAIAGYTQSYGAGTQDFWLVKTDSSGTMQWNKTYGATGNDLASSLAQTSDGGYAIAGSTASYGGGNYDFWLVKTDSAGNAVWNRTYGGTGHDYAYSVVETGDGGYALVGHTYSYGAGSCDFWLVKTDSSGNMLWNKTYGGTNDDAAQSVVQTGDGGYALAGRTLSYGAGLNDFWLVKTDSAGTMLWSKTYGGVSHEGVFSVVETVDGGYALAGYTGSYGAGSNDFWLVKVKPDMNLEHQRNLGNENGLARTGLTNTTIILYRGATDTYWNYVRVRIWLIKEPSWIYGDINMDGIVDRKDLYIVGRNYGKTFSLLSLTGIIAVAGICTYKKRKQAN